MIAILRDLIPWGGGWEVLEPPREGRSLVPKLGAAASMIVLGAGIGFGFGIGGAGPAAVGSTPATDDYPNEPAGMTRFFESNHDSRPSGVSAIDGGGDFIVNPDSLLQAVTSDGPQSPTGALQYIWETDTPAGYFAKAGDYMSANMWDDSTTNSYTLSSPEYSEFYYSHWMRVGLVDSVETQSVGVKFLGYIGFGQNNELIAGNGPVEGYWLLMNTGGGGTSFENEWSLRYANQLVTSTNYEQNRNTGFRLSANQWVQVEGYHKLNDIGSQNGVVRMWVNDTLVIEHDTVTYITGSNPSGFRGWYLKPIWGGQGGTDKTVNDRVLFDHTYMSGVWLRGADSTWTGS